MGFEPTRAEHIGLAGRRLNHSATLSVADFECIFTHSRSSKNGSKMSAVGFEPTRTDPLELESNALDHSATLTVTMTYCIGKWS